MSIRTVAILGAGHGGCAAAADLGRRGFEVRLRPALAAIMAIRLGFSGPGAPPLG